MASSGQSEDQVKVVVKNTFLELAYEHKAVQDFRECVGIFRGRARSDSPGRGRSRHEDLDIVTKKCDVLKSVSSDDILGEVETDPGDSTPSEVSSGNDLMSQESFPTEVVEKDSDPQQNRPLTQKRTPLRTPLKSQSSPFVPMFQWSCMAAPFLHACESDDMHTHGSGEESGDFDQQVIGCVPSPMAWSSGGYGMQSWYSSDTSPVTSPLASARQKQQKVTPTDHYSLPQSEEDYTTVMFRNLPNDYSQKMLLALLESEGFDGLYDFVYVPFDFKRHAGLGYAFINMVSPDAAKKIKTHLQGFKKWSIPSKKILEVCYSKPLQGLAANIERYRNSPVMHPDVPEEFKPTLYHNKQRIPFPAPTITLRPPSAA